MSRINDLLDEILRLSIEGDLQMFFASPLESIGVRYNESKAYSNIRIENALKCIKPDVKLTKIKGNKDYKREDYYDKNIWDLMSEVIEICKAEKIDFISGFSLEDIHETEEGVEGEDKVCVTAILDKNISPKEYIDAFEFLRPKPRTVIAMTIIGE